MAVIDIKLTIILCVVGVVLALAVIALLHFMRQRKANQGAKTDANLRSQYRKDHERVENKNATMGEIGKAQVEREMEGGLVMDKANLANKNPAAKTMAKKAPGVAAGFVADDYELKDQVNVKVDKDDAPEDESGEDEDESEEEEDGDEEEEDGDDDEESEDE